MCFVTCLHPQVQFWCESLETPNPLVDKNSSNVLCVFCVPNTFHTSDHWVLGVRQDDFRQRFWKMFPKGLIFQKTGNLWRLKRQRCVGRVFQVVGKSISEVTRLGVRRGCDKATPEWVWGILNYLTWILRNRMDQGLGNTSKTGAMLNLLTMEPL